MASPLIRKKLKVFARSAANNGQFGSAQVGTKVTSNDLDILQALAATDTGWNNATIGGQKLPTLEEMQALHYIATYSIAYLFEKGIAEWEAATEYFQTSIVRKTGTYELYGSIIDNNIGNALPNAVSNANWTYLGTVGGLPGASNAQSNTGTANNVALTPANFGSQQIKATSGYQRLPGGMILQWGTSATLAADADATITFPVAFTSFAQIFTQFNYTGARTDNADLGQVRNPTLVDFIITNQYTAASQAQQAGPVAWFAIGS